jgi:hypothetical protein
VVEKIVFQIILKSKLITELSLPVGPDGVDDFLEVGSSELITASVGKESKFETFSLSQGT